MKTLNFLVLISCCFLSLACFAKNQDLALIAPEANLPVPDPQLETLKKAGSINKSKTITTLEMSENLTLQPRIEYGDYFNIKPTKPQTFGFNLFWDI